MPTPLAPRPSRGTPSRPIRQPQPRLALCRLEDRRTPATIAWDGGPTGNGTVWLDPTNWAGDVLPGPGDDATLSGTGINPQIVIATNAAVRSVTSSRAIEITGGALALGANTSIVGFLTLNGGTLDPTDGTTIDRGTISGPTAFAIGTGETVYLSTSTVISQVVVNAPLANAGTIVVRRNLTVTGSYTSTAGSALRVQSGSGGLATVTMAGFTNNGLIELSGTNQAEVDLTISGGVLTNASGGTVSAVNTGNYIRSTNGARFENQGTLSVAGKVR